MPRPAPRPTQPPGWPLHHRSDRRTYTLGEPSWTACLAPDTDTLRLLNAKASVGGGDRGQVSKVIAKKSASLAAAYGAHYLEQPHRRRHDSGLVGMLVNVPQSHGNKYGYATRGVILEQQRSRCLIRLDITDEERWHPTTLVRRWLHVSGKDVEKLSTQLSGVLREPCPDAQEEGAAEGPQHASAPAPAAAMAMGWGALPTHATPRTNMGWDGDDMMGPLDSDSDGVSSPSVVMSESCV